MIDLVYFSYLTNKKILNKCTGMDLLLTFGYSPFFGGELVWFILALIGE